MGSFQRGFLGYRRSEVDAAMVVWAQKVVELDRELAYMSGLIVEREREIRDLQEELRLATERGDRSLASIEAISLRLEEVQAQARGQATRIRMKALHEAVEVSRKVQELAGRIGAAEAAGSAGSEQPAEIAAIPKANGHTSPTAPELFEGQVEVQIGPLGDFSQLVSFEDAAGQIAGTSEISVERFSEGRATLSLRLDEPVELLRELEARSPLEFRVRHIADESVVLDVDDEQGPEQRAA
jgi:chromosome segregation ATPase